MRSLPAIPAIYGIIYEWKAGKTAKMDLVLPRVANARNVSFKDSSRC